jgi:hypothetical protein
MNSWQDNPISYENKQSIKLRCDGGSGELSKKGKKIKQMQGQPHVNRAWQVATIWSVVYRQSAIKRFEHEILQVTLVKCKFLDTLFQHHGRQLLQAVGTMAADPRSIFPNEVSQMKTTAEELAFRVANMMADKRVKYEVHASKAETEATTWSDANKDRIVNPLDW